MALFVCAAAAEKNAAAKRDFALHTPAQCESTMLLAYLHIFCVVFPQGVLPFKLGEGKQKAVG